MPGFQWHQNIFFQKNEFQGFCINNFRDHVFVIDGKKMHACTVEERLLNSLNRFLKVLLLSLTNIREFPLI